MGRLVAGGIFGQPPVVGGRASITGLDLVSPDTSLDLTAAVVRQNDPGQPIIQQWQNSIGTGVAQINSSGLFTAGSFAGASAGPSAGQQHTLPEVASDTFALLVAAQTLSNKTLASSTINTPALTLETGTPTGAARLAYSAGFLRLGDGVASRVLVSENNTQTLSAKTLASPTLSGTVAGTYTIGGTPTLGVALAITGAVDIGTAGARAGTVFATTVDAANLAVGGGDITAIDELGFDDAVVDASTSGRLRLSLIHI